MALLKPTTSQLMQALPGWSIAPEAHNIADFATWQARHVPWTWTPEEFETQTRMLAMNDCPTRDMLAWLLHGVRWGKGDQTGGSSASWKLQDQVDLWKEKAPYIRAWVEGSKASVPEEALQVLCRNLVWHPVGRHSNFANILDDFYWAHEISQKPEKVNALAKPRSSFGSLELAHATQDQTFQFDCAECIVKKMHWSDTVHGGPYSGAVALLSGTALGLLPVPLQRSLVVAALQKGAMGMLSQDGKDRLHEIWDQPMPQKEQKWWENKSKAMAFARDTSQDLLEQGIHPLKLIYRDRSQDLQFFKDLNPDAFRMGYTLINLLAQNCGQNTLPLPDMETSGPSA